MPVYNASSCALRDPSLKRAGENPETVSSDEAEVALAAWLSLDETPTRQKSAQPPTLRIWRSGSNSALGINEDGGDLSDDFERVCRFLQACVYTCVLDGSGSIRL